MIEMFQESPAIEILPASVEACHQMIHKLQNDIKNLCTQRDMMIQKLRGWSFVQGVNSLRLRENAVAERESAVAERESAVAERERKLESTVETPGPIIEDIEEIQNTGESSPKRPRR